MLKTLIKLLLDRGVGSQFGEDRILASFLPDKGFYVDVGAYHPHLYSNTYRLYQKGWSGICVDPNPSTRRLFRLFRPRDSYFTAGVGVKGHRLYFQHKDGAYNGFSQHPTQPLIGTTEVPIWPLLTFINRPVDFLNVDCEGMDLEVLQTHDWKIKPTVIAVEGKRGSKVENFLIEKGYSLKAIAGETLIFIL